MTVSPRWPSHSENHPGKTAILADPTKNPTTPERDDDLGRLIEARKNLPDAIRLGIKAMVKAATEE